ncbi:MAG: F0F1 ATP synthase subunit B [Kiritimatiellae bacterium]|nr:F0F1 ATP synthase subunit B [Kiritimatiellia bacterium]
MISFDGGLFFWSLVTFGALLFVLARYAFKPLGKLLSAREESIRKALADAHDAHEKARQVQQENQKALNDVREEAGRIISEGHNVVEKMKHETRDRAKAEADEIVKQARKEIDRELQRRLEDLKGTVANLSVRISRQVLREQLDEDRHQQLAEDFVDRLKKTQTRTSREQ